MREIIFFTASVLLAATFSTVMVNAADFHICAALLLGSFCTVAIFPVCVDLALQFVTRIVRRRTLGCPIRANPLTDADGVILVVVPYLIGDDYREVVKRLEWHHLANPDPGIRFCLLVDYPDSIASNGDADARNVGDVLKRIHGLNVIHGFESSKRFFCLIRRRQWNAHERTWMGRERKRGKLEDLNNLLMGCSSPAFVNPEDVPSGLKVEFVFTIDADNELPTNSVRRLVAAARGNEHTNSRPRSPFEIFQPDIQSTVPLGRRSLFQAWQVGSLKRRTGPASAFDAWQWVFGRALYFGKGLYAPVELTSALSSVLPDNAILSHDVVEGSIARATFVAEAKIRERAPECYAEELLRRDRWNRGDWQNVLWLVRQARVQRGSSSRIALRPYTSLVVLLNGLRLLSPCLFLGILIVGSVVAKEPLVWTIALMVVFFAPWVTAHALALTFRRKVEKRSERFYLRRWASSCALGACHRLVEFCELPANALLAGRAIIVSSYRVLLRKPGTLEWRPFGARVPIGFKIIASGAASFSAAAAFESVLLAFSASGALIRALQPVLVCWLFSPVLLHLAQLPAIGKTGGRFNSDQRTAASATEEVEQ